MGSKAFVAMTSRRRRSSMEVSAHDGDFQAVVDMIANGTSVNARMNVPGGGTALHQAAFGNNADIADYLIKNGADVDATTDDGRTPLVCCCNGEGSLEVARLLLASGCKKDATNKNNLTALDLAVRASGQDELETLLRNNEVPGNSHLTNWRESAKKVIKINAVVNAFKPAGGAAEAEPKSPLSPAQKYKQEK